MTTSKTLQDNFLTCHICMEIYQHPCTLRCEHTYCRDCLTKYIKTQQDAIKDKIIPCPTCQQKTSVPDPNKPVEEWAGQLKPGLVIRGLMDSVIQDTDTCSVCSEEGKKTPAVHWCSECEASFCEECLKMHSRMPSSRLHHVTDLSKETPRSYLKKRKFICKEHDEDIKMFCKNCKKPACTVCSSVHHRKCEDVVTVKAVLPDVKGEVQQQDAKLNNQMADVSHEISENKKKLNEQQKNATSVKSKIKKTIKEAVDYLLQKEEQLLSKVDDLNQKQTQEMKAKIKCAEITMQVYQQRSEFIQHALKFDDEEKLFEMYLSSESGVEEDDTQMSREDTTDVGEIIFTHDMEKLKKEMDMMDVRDDGVEMIDLSVKPTLETVVDMIYTGETDSYLRDIVVVSDKRKKVIVVTDSTNKCIKIHNMENDKDCFSKLEMEHTPRCLALLKHNEVAATLPSAMKIVTVGVIPDLVLKSTIKTNKIYWGLDVLNSSSLVACGSSPPSVDILDMEGNVLKSFTEVIPSLKSLQDPDYLHVTGTGNIVVSDHGTNSVFILTPTDEIDHYRVTEVGTFNYLYGITSTVKGDILVANANVTHLFLSRNLTREILASSDVGYPDGLYLDGTKLYVTAFDAVRVFEFACH